MTGNQNTWLANVHDAQAALKRASDALDNIGPDASYTLGVLMAAQAALLLVSDGDGQEKIVR